jgi:D-sedoheptulose 7-phosphate isomerase
LVSSSTKAHFLAVRDALDLVDVEAVDVFTNWLRGGYGTIYVAGNGGSAANASHLALHLVLSGRKAVSLTDNGPLFSAMANDFGYAASMRPPAFKGFEERNHDLLVLLSCSGTSANIAEAAAGLPVGLVGGILGPRRHTGPVQVKGDYMLHVEGSEDFGVIEDVQSAIIHAVAASL